MSAKEMNMSVLDKLSAIEDELLDEIKNIDSQIATLRENRQKLSATIRSINPTALRREKKSK
jgi:hypothetical protein